MDRNASQEAAKSPLTWNLNLPFWSLRCPATCQMQLGTAEIVPVMIRNIKSLTENKAEVAQLHSLTNVQVRLPCIDFSMTEPLLNPH